MPLQKRVSELPAVATIVGTDQLIVSSANATKRCTVTQIGAFFQAAGVAGPPGPSGLSDIVITGGVVSPLLLEITQQVDT